MEVWHQPAGEDANCLADDVEVARTPWEQARGLMFRRPLEEGQALVFEFDEAKPRSIHSLGVFFPIDVVWVARGAVRGVKRLRPMLGYGRATAETIVELPAGAADEVETGHALRIPPDFDAEEGDG